MAKTPRFRWELPLGSDWQKIVTWYTDAAKTTPKDISGYTARMDIRRKVSDETALVSMTTTGGQITLGDAAGTIQMDLASTVTDDLPNGPLIGHMELISGSSKVTRLFEVHFNATAEVTR